MSCQCLCFSMLKIWLLKIQNVIKGYNSLKHWNISIWIKICCWSQDKWNGLYWGIYILMFIYGHSGVFGTCPHTCTYAYMHTHTQISYWVAFLVYQQLWMIAGYPAHCSMKAQILAHFHVMVVKFMDGWWCSLVYLIWKCFTFGHHS